MSGDSLEREQELLIKCGYKPENIRSAALFVSDIAETSNKQPNYYWFKLEGTKKYYYPWGRTILGKGYDAE